MWSPLRLAPAYSLLIVLASRAPAADQAGPVEQPRSDEEKAQIEERLFAYENEWVQTAFSKDASVLDRILADDLVYTTDAPRLRLVLDWFSESERRVQHEGN